MLINVIHTILQSENRHGSGKGSGGISLSRNLYVIVLPLLQDGLLEIYPYNQLLQKPYRKLDSRIRVVGFARGKEVAEQLVLQIIQDMYDETGEEWKVEDFFF